jgi:hypothetical protein
MAPLAVLRCLAWKTARSSCPSVRVVGAGQSEPKEGKDMPPCRFFIAKSCGGTCCAAGCVPLCTQLCLPRRHVQTLCSHLSPRRFAIVHTNASTCVAGATAFRARLSEARTQTLCFVSWRRCTHWRPRTTHVLLVIHDRTAPRLFIFMIERRPVYSHS